jgi:nicotinamide mononucleotide transporter
MGQGKIRMISYLLANWIEWTGWTTTLLGIWLTTRRLLWCWPVTLIADVLYLVVFYQAKLYSDTLLQAFFVAFTLYGWWNWSRGVRDEGEVKIAPLKPRNAIIAIALGAVGSIALYLITIRMHAALPWLDAPLASYSLVASWWQARRHIANWWLWIVIDVLYVGEYIYKQLWPTALLYAILVALAILGLRDWKRAPVAATA